MNKIFPYYLSLAIYLSLSIGFFIVKSAESQLNFAVSLLNCANLFFLLFLVLKNDPKLVAQIFFLSLPLFLCLFPSIIIAQDLDYASDKLIGFFIIPFISSAIFVYGCKYYGRDFLSAYIIFSFLILLITILFKMKVGFFYRPARYFLNGSIVFSWMMGVASLLSFHFYYKYGDKKYLFFFVIFVLAVIWGFSKGPILSVFLTLTLVMLANKVKLKSIMIYLIGVLSVCLLLYIFKDYPVVTRMLNVFFTDGNATEVSSVNSRYQLFSVTVDLIKNNLLTGVGLGNWQYYVGWGGAIYPHNFILELLSEAGLIMCTIYIFFLLYILSKLNLTFFSIATFLGICMLFSGDLTYIRMLNFFIISGFFVSKIRLI